MELHGVTWSYMELHGVTWSYMELHGVQNYNKTEAKLKLIMIHNFTE